MSIVLPPSVSKEAACSLAMAELGADAIPENLLSMNCRQETEEDMKPSAFPRDTMT